MLTDGEGENERIVQHQAINGISWTRRQGCSDRGDNVQPRADLCLRPGRPALEDHDGTDATATCHLCGALREGSDFRP